MKTLALSSLALLALMAPASALAQATDHASLYAPGEHYSRNIKLLSHIPLGRMFTVADIEIEQEPSRPFVYVARMHGITSSTGTTVISVKDPENAKVLYTWRIEEPELHRGYGALDNKYFKHAGRYYDIQSVQMISGSPNYDLGALVFDVTGLPDTSTFKEVARIRAPDAPGGFHNVYAYKHSDGRPLLFATTMAPFANIYDMSRVVSGDVARALIGKVPVPDEAYAMRPGRAYHDFHVAYDPARRRDVFYGGGSGGFHLYDVSRPEEPKLITSGMGIAGVRSGHTFTPTPDGRYVVLETEYQYAPLRIFDLKPALDGEVRTLSRPIGAWTARWQGLPHNHEVRWPYVFVSGYEDGFHVFNMMDPTNPYTVGFYDTYDGKHLRGWGGPDTPEIPRYGVSNGSFGVDIRNADGLIVASDMTTGFWAFKMDGFDGWNGHQWGMPNISSEQDWDNGPEGAPAPVS